MEQTDEAGTVHGMTTLYRLEATRSPSLSVLKQVKQAF